MTKKQRIPFLTVLLVALIFLTTSFYMYHATLRIEKNLTNQYHEAFRHTEKLQLDVIKFLVTLERFVHHRERNVYAELKESFDLILLRMDLVANLVSKFSMEGSGIINEQLIPRFSHLEVLIFTNEVKASQSIDAILSESDAINKRVRELSHLFDAKVQISISKTVEALDAQIMKTIFLFSIFTLVSIVTIIFYFKQKKNSAEANRLRLMVSNIIDAMPSMLIGVDGKLTVTQWNKEAEKRTGLTAKNVIDKPVDIVYPELTSEIQQIRTAIEKQQIHNIRQRARKTAEGLFYDDLTIFPLKIGSVQGAVIRIDDQTHQVQMNEMVVQSEKMRSVGGLAAGMAHEINNPLGIIMGLTQSISRRFSADLKPNKTVAGEIGLDLDKVQRYMKRREITVYLDGIKDAGLRAAKIVRDMLDFSRQSESIPSQCNIHVILDKAVELASSDYDLKKQFDFRSIIIERDYAEDLPIIDVVETEIEQVFLNLLKNAAQAQSEKQYIDASPKIILRTGFNADKIRIEIEDNGPGMSLDMTKRIFDPFFTTKEVGQGTGLGLSVSYFIITNTHNGSFTVESVENRGSKIIIQLPVREGAGK